MNITDQAISIIKSCKNEQQTEVATRFIELLIKNKNISLTKQERHRLLLAIDDKLNDLKNELLTQRRLAFV
jgi:F0F1-type ATP synthase delta subunit